MKESIYNKVIEQNIIFNARTCAVAKVDDIFFKVLDLVKCQQEVLEENDIILLSKMKEAGFIVDNDYDEIAHLKYKYYKSCFRDDVFNLTIAPTLNCNFRCPYCYESHFLGKMTVDVQNHLLDFVAKQSKRINRLHIEWYGGEPLLAIDVIKRLTKHISIITEKENVKFTSSMITNAYLLDDNAIAFLKKCNIEYMQVTLDGPPLIHNKRRKLKGDIIQDTFTKIINNVKTAINNGIKIKLRINIDKDNINGLNELFSLLVDRRLNNIPFYFGCVEKCTDVCPEGKSYLKFEDFSRITIELYKTAIKHGMNKKYYPFPKPKRNFCSACRKASLVVDPLGNLYKCWHDIGVLNNSVGNIINFSSVNESEIPNFVKWFKESPFDREECVSCYYLPLCMGGCPNKRLKGDISCERWKYILEDAIALKVKNTV